MVPNQIQTSKLQVHSAWADFDLYHVGIGFKKDVFFPTADLYDLKILLMFSSFYN